MRPARPKVDERAQVTGWLVPHVESTAATVPTGLANDTADAVTTGTAKPAGPGRLKRRRCTECGAEFQTRYKAYTCSDKCRRKRARRMAAKKARSVTGNKP